MKLADIEIVCIVTSCRKLKANLQTTKTVQDFDLHKDNWQPIQQKGKDIILSLDLRSMHLIFLKSFFWRKLMLGCSIVS